MSSGQSLFEAFGIMLFCLLMGLTLTIVFGTSTDILRNQFLLAGIYNVGGAWVEAQQLGSIDTLNNLILAICYFIPLFGVINFLVTCVRRQRYDQYGNQVDD